jgi:nucleoside-diphosphate-sugar epimerase
VRLVIAGSEGNIGRRLKAAFPNTVGIDVKRGADILADLATIDYSRAVIANALTGADAVIQLATSADPEAPDDVHWQAVANTARLFAACAHAGVPRIVVASSAWAEPKDDRPVNAYGHSKRVMEALAAMYGHTRDRVAVALRVGWVPESATEVASAPEWLRANHWDDARLVAEFRSVLGLPAGGQARTGSPP